MSAPEMKFIAATRALIRCHLPEPFHGSYEYEYKGDAETGKLLSLMVWKRDCQSRDEESRIIVLNQETQDLLFPIIKELHAEMTPLVEDDDDDEDDDDEYNCLRNGCDEETCAENCTCDCTSCQRNRPSDMDSSDMD